MAWLLAIVLVPWIGVPLYLLLAVRKERRDAALRSNLKTTGNALSPSDRLLQAYGVAPAVPGNHFVACETGEDAYRMLVDLIESAARRIHIEMFILHPDAVGRDILQRLARRAEEGVEVRLLLDAVGSFTTRAHFLEPLTAAGGHVAFSGRLWRLLWGRANQRNHRKIVLGDSDRVLAGGLNVAGEYLGPTPRPDRWRELAFMMEGPAVKDFAAIFRRDWERATGEPLETDRSPADDGSLRRGASTTQVVPSGPDVPGDPHYAALLSAIWASEQRFWTVTPYFVPDDALAQALSLAARRGVDVRILVPEHSNHRMADLARGTYLREVQQAGGRILLYTLGMMHAKAVVVDETLAILGSCNIDLRSLRLNYEASLFLYHAEDIRTISAWIDALRKDCREGVGAPSPFRDALEGAVRTAAPLL